jgi:hypothetical protein
MFYLELLCLLKIARPIWFNQNPLVYVFLDPIESLNIPPTRHSKLRYRPLTTTKSYDFTVSLLLVEPVDETELIDAWLDCLLEMDGRGTGLARTTLEGVVGVFGGGLIGCGPFVSAIESPYSSTVGRGGGRSASASKSWIKIVSVALDRRTWVLLPLVGAPLPQNHPPSPPHPAASAPSSSAQYLLISF